MKYVGLFESMFRKRVWTLHFDGIIHKEITKVVEGVRYVSSFGWCGSWHPVKDDGTFDCGSYHYQINWSFSHKDILKKQKEILKTDD